jgi:DNA-binding transcriptional ArsR family regulator
MPDDRSSGKVAAVIRILELFNTYGELSAGKILEKLSSEGLVKPSSRRLLNYYLEELEKLGLVELKGKGRGARWVLKKRPAPCNIDGFQKALIYLAVASLPDFMLKDLRDEIRTLFRNLGCGEHLADAVGVDPHLRYLWGVAPRQQLGKLSQILKAIGEKRFLSVIYEKRQNELRKILPVGVYLRRGKLYLTAVDHLGTRKTFAVEKILKISPSEKTYGGKHYPKHPFYAHFEEREKPFLFGLEVNKKLPLREEFAAFSPLIFHAETEGEVVKKVFLVGFTGDYFASRFLPFVYGRLIPPSDEVIELARRKKVGETFPSLPLTEEENLSRFKEFLKTLGAHLRRRLDAVGQTLAELENINPS